MLTAKFKPQNTICHHHQFQRRNLAGEGYLTISVGPEGGIYLNLRIKS
jgi:hypothetical protein